MTGLADDVALADSAYSCLGHMAGTQRVAAQRLWIQTGAPGGALQNPADAVLVEPVAGEFALTADPAKDGSGRDACLGQPGAQSGLRRDQGRRRIYSMVKGRQLEGIDQMKTLAGYATTGTICMRNSVGQWLEGSDILFDCLP